MTRTMDLAPALTQTTDLAPAQSAALAPPAPSLRSTAERGEDLRDPLARRLQVWSMADLSRMGVTRYRRDALVREGRLEKLGRSWYGTSLTPADVKLALASGQRLTCISALAHHGLWVPRDGRRHVTAVRVPSASRAAVRAPSGSRAAVQVVPGNRDAGGALHHRYQDSWRTRAPVMPIPEALRDAMSCLSIEDLAVVLESALAHGVLTCGEVAFLVGELPVQRRRQLGRISPAAQSGTETRVRRFLERLGVRVREQVQILQGEYVDLLVGERLVIECDSRAHHSLEDAYANDRRRDRELVLRGYWVVRLTWEDVMLRWTATQALLRALLREGRHRAPRRRQADGSRSRRVRR